MLTRFTLAALLAALLCLAMWALRMCVAAVRATAPLGGWCPLSASECQVQQQEEDEFRLSLKRSAKASEFLWLSFVRNTWLDESESRHFHLLEIMRQLDCLLTLDFCHVHMPEFASNFNDLCTSFKRALHVLAEIRPISDSDELLAMAFEVLPDHPCFVNDLEEKIYPELHDLLRHAVYVDVGVIDDSFPIVRVPRATVLLSPSNICAREDLLWWYASPPLEDVMAQDAFRALTSPSSSKARWLINVGAGDGDCIHDAIRQDGRYQRGPEDGNDPASCLLLALPDLRGILFEGDHEAYETLQRLHQRDGVKLKLEPATPHSVLTAVEEFRHTEMGYPAAASDLLLAKVDVDNCDCCFVEALLNQQSDREPLLPMLIHVEVHSFIPPPIVFRPLNFTEGVGDSLLELGQEKGRRGHFLHCSLSAFTEILFPLGYQLGQLIGFDAVFIHRNAMARSVRVDAHDVLHGSRVEALWYGCHFCHPLRVASPVDAHYFTEFRYDYRRWNDPEVSASVRIEEIRSYLDLWKVPRSTYALYVASAG